MAIPSVPPPATESARPPRGAPPSPHPSDVDDSDLFDYARLRDYLRFALGAVARRKWTVLLVFAFVLAAAFGALAVLPKTYHSEIKISAQRNVVISTLSGFTHSWDYELPTRAASDLVLRHDNLVSLVRKTELVRTWESSRAPILRLKDAVMKRIRGEMPEHVKEDLIVGTLEQRLWVQVTDDSVLIALDWPDARAAYRLIQAAHENFLEARQYKEVSAASEAIGLLQGRALDSREKVRANLLRLQTLRNGDKKAAPQRKAAPAPRVAAVAAPDPEIYRLRGQLRSKQQVILEMEEFRRRRIAELASKLAELRQVFNEFHPAVIDLQQSLQQQERQENPQLATLRQEYRGLEQQYERRGGPALDMAEPNSPLDLPSEALRLARLQSEDLESPEIEQANADLKYEVGRYSNLVERVEQAKAEVESQRAAFPYRYGVLRPAALPALPIKPKRAMVLGASAAMGLLLGLLAAVLLDIRSRLVLQRWQVQRQLQLAVLGEVRMP